MSAAVLTKVASARSTRLLADVGMFRDRDPASKTPVLARLEAELGRDFADRLVAALSDKQYDARRL